MMSTFNDPKSNVNVMILNKRCGSAGLNFHYCCHIGIQLQYDWNIGSLVQGRGRLIRIAQGEEVIWIVMRVNDTAYDFYEWKALKKERMSLETELCFPDWLVEFKYARQLIAYEVLRVAWSQPFHRFVWEMCEPRAIQDFNSDETRAKAQFYHLLSRLILKTTTPPPDSDQLLNELSAFIDVISAKWVEGRQEKLYSSRRLTWGNVVSLLEAVGSDQAWVEKQRMFMDANTFGSSKKRKIAYDPWLEKREAKKAKLEEKKAERAKAKAEKAKASGKAAKSAEFVHPSEDESDVVESDDDSPLAKRSAKALSVVPEEDESVVPKEDKSAVPEEDGKVSSNQTFDLDGASDM